MSKPDGVDEFFVILAIFILDPDDIITRAYSFLQARLFYILVRLFSDLANRLLFDRAAVAYCLIRQARYGIAAENESEIFAPRDFVHFVPAVFRVREPGAGAGHDILFILVDKIQTVVDARIGKHQLAVAALRVVNYIKVSVLIRRNPDLHLIAGKENRRRACIRKASTARALDQAILNRKQRRLHNRPTARARLAARFGYALDDRYILVPNKFVSLPERRTER